MAKIDILRKVLLQSSFLKHFDQNWDFRKFEPKSRFSKILKKSDFGQNFRKIAILVKLSENLDFCEDIRNASILVTIFKNLDLDKIFEKERFSSKFAKISSLVLIYEKDRFYLKHLDFGQNFWKSRFWFIKIEKSGLKSQFSKYLDLAIIFENLNFGEDFSKLAPFWPKFPKKSRFWSILRKISIYVNFEKSGFWSKFSKNSDFDQNLWKFFFMNIFEIPRFWSKFSKYHDFGQIFWKILILVKIYEKSRFWSNFRIISKDVKLRKIWIGSKIFEK